MDSRSLRCPRCGAATASGAPRCQYCQAPQRQIDDLREERSRLQVDAARAQRLAGRGNELSWRSESAALTLPELLTLFSGD